MALVLTSPLLSQHGFRHGFSTRQGGVSHAPFDSLNVRASVDDDPDHVAENLRRVAAAVGYAAEQLFTLTQVHGRSVRVLAPDDTPERVRAEQADALVAAPGFAVGVRSADCVPVLLVDPVRRQVAAVHAGWRGVVAEVVPAALDALCASSGAPASQLCAAIFPHIRRCCFEVGAEVAQQLAAANPGTEQCQFPREAQQLSAASTAVPGKALVALDVIVRAQLAARGLLAANMDDVPGCTACDRERFFSYRRDGARFGLHLAVVLG